MKCWFDGSSTKTRCGYGIIIKKENSSRTTILKLGVQVEDGLTNNTTEFLGLIGVLKQIDEDAQIYGDSLLVINLMKGIYNPYKEKKEKRKKEGKYLKYYKEAKEALDKLDSYHITFHWIPRKENKEADSLATGILKKKKKKKY